MINHSRSPSQFHDNNCDPVVVTTRDFGPQWAASISSVRNSRTDCVKPNEDRVVVNSTRQSIVIADGITRSKSSDGSYPAISPSARAAMLFCETVTELLCDRPTTDRVLLEQAVTKGNKALQAFNRTCFPKPDFALNDLAGVAALIAVLDKDNLWIASIADCFSLVAKPLCIERLAWEKTSHSSNESKRLGEIEARRQLRNKRNSPFGYGALTGEEDALSFVQYQCFNVKFARRLVFATDGLLALATERPSVFAHSSISQIVSTARIVEKQRGETDDKTIVVLDRKS